MVWNGKPPGTVVTGNGLERERAWNGNGMERGSPGTAITGNGVERERAWNGNGVEREPAGTVGTGNGVERNHYKLEWRTAQPRAAKGRRYGL